MTDESSAEAARLRAEFDEFLYLLPEALVEVDLAKGRLTRMNYTAQVLLGYSDDDLARGLPARALLDDASFATIAARLAADRAASEDQGQPYQRSPRQNLFELTFVRKDGTTFPGEAQASYLLDEEGAITGLRAMFRDISDRRRTEAALRESVTLLDTTFASIAETVIIVDREMNVLALNRAASDMLRARVGSSPSVGQDVAAFVGAPFSGSMRESHARALAGETVRVERQLHLRDGTEAWFEYVYTPMRVQGAIEGVAIVGRDITERKRSEEERIELERRMQESQRLESLGVLAGGIAHDFNNLLMAIIGNTDLVRADIGDDDDLGHLLKSISDAGHEASRLVAQLLDFAGVRTAAAGIEPLDPNALVNDVLSLVHGMAKGSVDINLRLSRSVPPIMGNATQLRQVLLNLVLNAIEAHDDQPGTVEIRTHQARSNRSLPRGDYATGTPADRPWVVLSIRDSGAGIAPDILPRIFEPFFTTKFMGRGLGLAAASGIVRTHGGLLIVRSQPGKGSTFSLCLPAAASV